MEPRTVADEVRLTTKCLHDCSCLTTGFCGTLPKCEVLFEGGKNILFLKAENWRACINREYAGFAWLCRCPIHFDTYLQDKRQQSIH